MWSRNFLVDGPVIFKDMYPVCNDITVGSQQTSEELYESYTCCTRCRSSCHCPCSIAPAYELIPWICARPSAASGSLLQHQHSCKRTKIHARQCVNGSEPYMDGP